MQAECVEQYISSLRCGDVIPACVSHMEKFGVFLDIGSGINALMPIDSISISRIPVSYTHLDVYKRQNYNCPGQIVISGSSKAVSYTHLDLDLIIVASASPDYAFPATACIVQNAISAKSAARCV